MSTEVPFARNTPQITAVLASKIVSGLTWADVGRLLNWIHGRGMHVIPTYSPGRPTGATAGPALSKATNDDYRHRFYFRPQFPALERMFTVLLEGDGDLDFQVDSGTIKTLVAGFGTAGAVNTFKYVIPAQLSTDEDLRVDMHPQMNDITVLGLSAVDVPRYDLVADANDLGVEIEKLRSGQPIKREDLDELITALAGLEVGRRVLLNWAVPYHDGNAVLTTYAALSSSGSFSDIWADPVPVLARKLGPAATTGTITCRMYAWVSDGTGEVRLDSSENGSSNTVSVTATTPTWTDELTLDVDCTDLTVVDGRRGAAWDDLDAVFRHTLDAATNEIYVASVAIWEGEWTPAQLAPDAWWRADAAIVEGTGVSQLTDKSGNGYHLTQSTTANQPAFNASDAGYGNQPTMDFDGVTEYLEGGDWLNAGTGDLTAIIIGEAPTAASVRVFLTKRDGNNAGWRVRTNASDGFQIVIEDGSANEVTVAAKAFTVDTPSVFRATVDGGTDGQSFVDGTGGGATSTAAVGDIDNATNVFLGSKNNGTLFFDGTIAECIVLLRIPTAAELANLVVYINNRYSLSLAGA
jgi:hypothetical protein